MYPRYFVWILVLPLLFGPAGDVLAAPSDGNLAVLYLGPEGRVSQALELVPDLSLIHISEPTRRS